MNNDQLIIEEVKRLKGKVEEYLQAVDLMGGQCAYTDAILEFIINTSEQIKTLYESNDANINVYWLDTFPKDDDNYAHMFKVPFKWLCKILKSLKDTKNSSYNSFYDFNANYTWDFTQDIYAIAENDGVIIDELESETIIPNQLTRNIFF